jgi:hypothetical protein
MAKTKAVYEREERRKHELKEYLIRDINDLSLKLDNLRSLAHNIAYLTRELNLDSTFNFLTEIENILLSISDNLRLHSNKLMKIYPTEKAKERFEREIRPSVNHKIIRATKK